jgi:cysteinyl-tRNA synthetase
MSKSLGNFFTVREIEEHYDLQVLRLFMLSAHYRSPLNFSDQLMESAKSSLERITNAVDNLNFRIANAKDASMNPDETAKAQGLADYTKRFDEAMDDDINTADALAVIFDLVRFANSEVDEASSAGFVQAVKDEILMLGNILGMKFERKEEVLDSQIEALIAERQAARKAKNFARADEIRDQLAGMGITLLDTREGVKWKRN